MTIILQSEHPSNKDPTARLTEGSAGPGKPGIYRVRGGYLACLNYPHCLAGLFDTEAEAREAQERNRHP